MTDAYDVVHIAESKFQKLVGEDRPGICESKQRMVRKDCPQTHRSGMQDSFMTEAAQARVPMDDFDLFSDDYIAKDWEEGEHSRKSCLSIDHPKWDMIDFETVCQVMYTSPAFVGMRDNDDLVASVNQFRGQLINVTFHASGLWKEEVADHGNVVRHCVSTAGLRSFEQQSSSRRSWRYLHFVQFPKRRDTN